MLMTDKALYGQTGNVTQFFPAPNAGNGRGLAFDGVDLYYTLWLGGIIFRVTTGGAALADITPTYFSTFPLGQEDLAFDSVTFAPDCAVWGHNAVEFGQMNFITAYEVPCPVVTERLVDIDIKFCSDPNGYNCKKHGVLPVTVFGNAVDVSDVDASSLQLCLASDTTQCTNGPVDSSIADRGDATTDIGAAACQIIDGVEQDFLNRDGLDDLEVVFDSQEVTDLVNCDTLEKKDTSPTLVLIGQLNDGTPLTSVPVDDVGIDQLLVQNK